MGSRCDGDGVRRIKGSRGGRRMSPERSTAQTQGTYWRLAMPAWAERLLAHGTQRALRRLRRPLPCPHPTTLRCPLRMNAEVVRIYS